MQESITAIDPDGLIQIVIAKPPERQQLEQAIEELRRQLQEACECRKYFAKQPNPDFQDLDTWLADGGPPYLHTRDRSLDRRAPSSVRGWSDQRSPWQTTRVYRDNFRPDRRALTACDFASLLLHEAGHLARQDTTDFEDPEFFKACSVGCLRPGRFH